MKKNDSFYLKVDRPVFTTPKEGPWKITLDAPSIFIGILNFLLLS